MFTVLLTALRYNPVGVPSRVVFPVEGSRRGPRRLWVSFLDREGDAGLAGALAALGLRGELNLSGRWLKLRGDRFPVYVVEVSGEGAGFYTWCGDPGESSVEFHRDPVEAIRSGMRRAAGAP